MFNSGAGMTPGQTVNAYVGAGQTSMLHVLGTLPDGTLVVHMEGQPRTAVHLVAADAVAAAAQAFALIGESPEEWIEAWLTSQGGPLDLIAQTQAALDRLSS